MAAENEIQLKITIDGKDAIATLKLTEDEVKKLKTAMDTAGVEQGFNKSTRAVSQFGNVSKRDLGMFANQMLISSGVTGRMTGQLSNLATGLATGGAIGAAFAGASALIGSLTAQTAAWGTALENAASKLVVIKSSLDKFRFEIAVADLNKVIQATEESIKEVESEFGKRVAKLAKKYPILSGIVVGSGIAPSLAAIEIILQQVFNKSLVLTEEELNRLKADKQILEHLQKQQNEYKAQQLIAERLEKLGAKRVDTTIKELSLQEKLNQAASFAMRHRPGFDTTGLNPGEFNNLQLKEIPEWRLEILRLKHELPPVQNDIISLTDVWNAGLERASSNVAMIGSQWMLVRLGIHNANSVLQIFLQGLIQAASEQAIFSLVSWAMGGIGNFFGFGGAGMAMAEGGSGVVTKPTLFLAGEGGPEAFNFTPMDKMNSSSVPVQKIVVQVEGEFTQKGMDMRSVLRQVEEKIRSGR